MIQNNTRGIRGGVKIVTEHQNTMVYKDKSCIEDKLSNL